MERIAAGAVVFFVLIVAADVPTTSQLAVAFAYLILISAALTVGPVAFGRVSAMVGTTGGDPSVQTRNSGRGSKETGRPR